MDHSEPLAKADIRVPENGPYQHREAVAVLSAPVALPFELHGGDRADLIGATAGADNGSRPAVLAEVLHAGRIRRKRLFPLGNRHLVNTLGGAHV